MKAIKLLCIILFLKTSFFFSQSCNVNLIICDNKKTNKHIESSAHYLFLDNKTKFNNFNVIHYSNFHFEDTIWQENKKKVKYHFSKIDCDFELKNEFKSFHQTNRLLQNESTIDFLISSEETINSLANLSSFKVITIDDFSDFILKNEIDKIRLENLKNNISIYIVSNKNTLAKPFFSFDSDTLISSDNVSLNYKTSSEIRDVVWSKNMEFVNNDLFKPILKITKDQIVTGYYIDKNGCKSNDDQVYLKYKENCNCNEINGQPEIIISESNLIARGNRKAIWDYQISPYNGSGHYVYRIVSNNVCSDFFLVEITDNKEILRFSKIYSRTQLTPKNLKDRLVFNIPMYENEELIKESNVYFNISIVPIISDDTKCFNRKYILKKIKFSKCDDE